MTAQRLDHAGDLTCLTRRHAMNRMNRALPVLSCLVFLLPACETPGRAEIRSVRIASSAMGGKWPGLVVLPASYAREPDRRFPVLYLLHGASGEHTSWVANTPLAKLLENESKTRDVIVVCPNGRGCGWYVDSPHKRNSNVETHLVKELIPHIDSNFRTEARRGARGIAGYSMGGHGALTLAAKHPELFASASSLSGILDITRWPGHWRLRETFGPLEENRDFWVANSALGLAPAYAGKARGVSLLIDCGDGDPAFEENGDYHRRLEGLGVPHVYKERPGGHTWRYWAKHLAEHLDFHLASFELIPFESAGELEEVESRAVGGN